VAFFIISGVKTSNITCSSKTTQHRCSASAFSDKFLHIILNRKQRYC
jgi:hypothetical protein